MSSHVAALAAARNALKGKVALVTGAGKRLGRAIAIALAEMGVHIVVHERKGLEIEAGRVCDEVVGCGARSWKVFADLERREEYETLIARSLKAAGSLDMVVNNASLFLPDTLRDVGKESMLRHLEVNAWAPFVISRDFARLAGRGKIVNLLDTRIEGSDRKHAGYILSKHLLAEVTRMCALEFAPRITVNAVAPGLILPPAGKDESYLKGLAGTVPLERHGNPADVADAVLYLLQSEFITGQIIYVDGGRHLEEYGNGPDRDP